MNTPRDEVYHAIDTERDYQNAQWPDRVANQLSIGNFILLISEYSDRARKEWSMEKKPALAALNTIRKIAGIAVNAMEQHGAPPRQKT